MWTSGQNHDIRNYWCSDTKIIKIKCKLFLFFDSTDHRKKITHEFSYKEAVRYSTVQK